jgi:catechol 2,3-dioxygenase-like lactoylglutathione lyase family enzyme
MRLQHVSVPMPPGRLEDARAFYSGVLGLAEKPVPASLGEGLLWLAAGQDELEVHLFPDRERANARQHFALAVDDLDEVRARLEERGHAVEEAVPIPNRPRLYTRDPFGNRIELTELLELLAQ